MRYKLTETRDGMRTTRDVSNEGDVEMNDDAFVENIGDKIRKAYMLKGWILGDFADAMGISTPIASRITNGDMTHLPVQLMNKIAKILDVSFGCLFGPCHAECLFEDGGAMLRYSDDCSFTHGVPTKDVVFTEPPRNVDRLPWWKTMMRVQLDDGDAERGLSAAQMPTRAHDADAGYDLYARECKTVSARGSAVFDTGVHMEIPKGYAGIIISKSGLNVNHGITSEGLVDSGYNGSIRVKLYNRTGVDYPVSAGQKISQIVLVPVYTPKLVQVKRLGDTERGDNGFGSSGK